MTNKSFTNQKSGFTFIEIMIGILLFSVIIIIAVPSVMIFEKNIQLNNAIRELVNSLKFAQNKALSSENNSQYGIYFDINANPQKYIIFKGSNFASRDQSFDELRILPSFLEFYNVNLEGGNEIVFSRITGNTQNSGNLSLRLKNDHAQTKTIYINNLGIITFQENQPILDTRVKDSRHITFEYSRLIDTANENLVLTFGGTDVKTIPLSQGIAGGQYYFEKTYNIGGENQKIIIHTLSLNSPGSEFSVFRDRRFNSKSLKIELSGDSTGALIQYSANGLTVTSNSIYVSNLIWQ